MVGSKPQDNVNQNDNLCRAANGDINSKIIMSLYSTVHSTFYSRPQVMYTVHLILITVH